MFGYTKNLLVKENKRLEKENVELKRELDTLLSYKDDYQNLITDVKKQKEKYLDLNKKMEQIIEDCKKSLERI